MSNVHLLPRCKSHLIASGVVGLFCRGNDDVRWMNTCVLLDMCRMCLQRHQSTQMDIIVGITHSISSPTCGKLIWTFIKCNRNKSHLGNKFSGCAVLPTPNNGVLFAPPHTHTHRHTADAVQMISFSRNKPFAVRSGPGVSCKLGGGPWPNHYKHMCFVGKE